MPPLDDEHCVDFPRAVILKALVFALFCASLFLEGLEDTRGAWQGYMILLVGWMGPFALNFAWYANPLLLFSLFVAHKRRGAALSALFVGFALALSAFMLGSIPYDDGSAKVLHLGWGYYLWLTCFPIALAAILSTDEEEDW